ncbi:MAG TPA: MarR family winged helix-turn-helix transcriptional regulator [Acidimicrobiales bacterium]|nr:MarR family winged helix-turn-helix transcriptional regulator [Acidimicrobiales bacterium]
MEQTRWLDGPEDRAWQSLQFMQMRLTAELSRQLAEHSSLSYPDYIVLVALTAQPDGRCRIFEVANEIGWEKSRLSHHIGRMSARGLVTREQCDSDRRGAFVVITELGRKELEAAAPGHVDAVRRLFIDGLSAEQLTVIAEVAETTLERLPGSSR